MERTLPRERSSSARAGFSLIELMVTIAVLGIIATITAPNLIDMIDKRRAVGAAEEVVSLLHLARSEAIKQSRRIRVTISEGATGAWFIGLSQGAANCSTAADCQISEGGVMLTRMSNASRYPGVALDASLGSITFDARGLVSGVAAGSNAELNLASERDWQAQVEINPIGRIQICAPSGAKNAGGYRLCPAQAVVETDAEGGS